MVDLLASRNYDFDGKSITNPVTLMLDPDAIRRALSVDQDWPMLLSAFPDNAHVASQSLARLRLGSRAVVRCS